MSEQMMVVKSEIPMKTWLALEKFAKHEGYTGVGELLAVIADRAVIRAQTRARLEREIEMKDHSPRDDLDHDIKRLNGEGKNDSEIARALHISQSTVSYRRRRMQLSKHARGGRLSNLERLSRVA